MPVVQRLPRVLLEMQPLDPHRDGLPIRQINDDLALAHERRFVLADLIALRQIGIKVVLAIEHGFEIDARLEPEAGAHCLLDALLVDDRQHARHGGIDERHLRIGFAAECGRGPRKQF